MASGAIRKDQVHYFSFVDCNSATSDKGALDILWSSIPDDAAYYLGSYGYHGSTNFIARKSVISGGIYGFIMSIRNDGTFRMYFVSNGTATMKTVTMS